MSEPSSIERPCRWRGRRAPGRSRARAELLALGLLWLALLFGAPAARAQQGQVSLGGAPQEGPVQEGVLVLKIEVEGHRRYTAEQLRTALGQELNQRLDVNAIDAGIRRLWSSFHVRADVFYREVPGGVEIKLEVVELPVDREPRFVGNVEIDTDELRKWGLIENQTELFLHQATRVRQRILEGYRQEGYYHAEVDIVSRGGDEQASEALPDVIFDIREGPKVRVRSVELHGNDAMPDTRFLFFKDGLSALSKRKLSGPSLFAWRGTAFVMETLEADILAMRGVYRDRGFLDAVVELERLEFNEDRDRVTVHIKVDEGQPYRVSKLSIEAVAWEDPEDPRSQVLTVTELLYPEPDLLELCEVGPGVVYEQILLGKDRKALREYYGKRAHISHPSLPRRVNWSFEEPELTFEYESKTVAVVYRLVQGRALKLREILFAGTHHTRDRVLRRELSVFPGDAANLDEIQKSLARINGTGYFRDEFNRLEHKDPTYRFMSVEDDPSVVDLMFEVEEGRVVDFNLTGGVDSNDGAFGLLALTMRNFDITDRPSSFLGTFSEIYHKEAFHGAGQLLQAEIAPGTRVSRFRLRFLEPDVFRRHLKPISLDIDLQKRLRRFDSHDEDRFAKSLKLGRRFDYDFIAWLGYVHVDLEVDDLDGGGVPPLLAAEEALGKYYLSGLTLDFLKRELDNPFSPHSGYSLRQNNVVYGGFLGGEFDFFKTEVRADWYTPLWAKEDGTRTVLHMELDAGVAQPYGDTDDVPYSERYFLGGSRTLRGFDFRGVGPDDPASGFALGGETFISGTLQLQYPLHSITQPGSYERIETLIGGLFLDFGVLDVDPFQADLGDMRASLGFAVGLAYPLPLTLNFGFPILIEGGDQRQVFSFSLGNF